MAKKETEQKMNIVRPARKSVWKSLKEMIGRTSDDDVLSQRNVFWTRLFDSTTEDTSRPDYTLNMAIYKASIVKNSEGKKKGEEYIFGATFGKPIVNATAAFAFTGLVPPRVSGEGDFFDDVNTFLYAERKTLFDAMRFGSRDGDAFVRLVPSKDNAYLEMISPEMVEVITNPENINEVIGYNITHVYYKDDKKTDKEMVVEEYRNTEPYYRRIKYSGGARQKGEEQEVDNDYPFLLMAHYANEKDPNARYGTSDYQNVYVLMKAYHAVMENGLKGAIYNSQPTPYIKGIANFQKFVEQNFEKISTAKDGQAKYQIEWRPDRMLLLGENMDMGMLTIPDHVTAATTMLEYLFYCIVQASETPEFVMGSAVASSKASVSEQLPVIVNKAYRKRADFENFLYDVIDIYSQYLLATSQIKANTIPSKGFNIEWSPIENEDKQLNLEVVKSLKELGLITDETALALTNIKIEDVDAELTRARQQAVEKMVQEMKQSDIYSPFSAHQYGKNKDVKQIVDDDDYQSKRKIKK